MAADGVNARGEHEWLVHAAPAAFVLLWSTGFLGVKFGLPYADPFVFLAIRFGLTAAIMVAVALAMRVAWPAGAADVVHSAVVGVLLHFGYITGVIMSLSNGISAGVVALIAGLQPLITAALVGPILGEKVSGLQWTGLLLGFAGVPLVVYAKLSAGEATSLGFAFTVLCLASITVGTLYQKRFCGGLEPRTSLAIQLAVASALSVAAAGVFGEYRVDFTGEFVFAVVWLAVVVSVGAISLLFFLLRRGAAARVTSLFYLTPPTTALLGYFLFGETLGPLALAGMALAVIGVALANR